MWARTLVALATELVNPALVLWALLAPVARRAGPGQRARFWVRAALGIGSVYLLTAIDRRLGLWGSRGLDFSTHGAFAVSLAVSLALLRPRWLVVLVPVLLAYAFAMVELRYHSLADFFTSAAAQAPLTLLCHARRPRRAVEA